MRLLTGDSMAFGYDTLSRLKTRKIAGQVLETYSYTPGSGSSTTTTLVAEKKNQVNGSTVQNLQYQYDARGNITKVADTAANTSVFYTYDCQGQLLKAIHKKGTATQRTETYTYDTYGNIRSFSNGTNSHSYTYADTQGWKDLLTKVDGHSLSYDGSGNPLSYYNGKSYTMTWNEGRQLASLTTGGKTTTYAYDLNGFRTKKVNPDGTWVKYFVGDGKILGETLHAADNHEVYDMRYTFDENGEVCGISLWNQGDTAWTKYYFVKNLQGDVLAVYQYGSSFTKVAEYTYDSWGNVLTATGALANINPFRYRSYYQDTETGFYYLQSRYYDPAIGRFINADSFASTGQDFIGCNMFAYCGNSPVVRIDFSGKSFAVILGVNLNIFGWGATFSINLVSTEENWGMQYSYYLSDDADISKKNNQTVGVDVGPYIGIQYTDKTKMKDLEGYAKATGGDLFLGVDFLAEETGNYLGWQYGVSFFSANTHSLYTNTKTLFSVPTVYVFKIVKERMLEE